MSTEAQIEVRPATLEEILETIAEVFDLRSHTIHENYDRIDDWEAKAALADSRASTIRQAASRIHNLEEMLARSRAHLGYIAGHLTTDEGDEDATEEEFGLDASEVVEMAHDNLINRARIACEEIDKFKALSASEPSK